MTESELTDALRAAWCAETSDHPELWTSDNPARCQCGSTALVVREILGGEILIADVFSEGRRAERHAWNRLPDGRELDLTRDQFLAGEEVGEGVPGEPASRLVRPEAHVRLLEAVRLQLKSARDRANAKRS